MPGAPSRRHRPASLEAVRALGRSLGEALDLHPTAQLVGEQIVRAVSAHRVALFVAPGPGEPLRLAFTHGPDPDLSNVQLRPDEPLVCGCLAASADLATPTLSRFPLLPEASAAPWQPLLPLWCLPMLARGQLVGLAFLGLGERDRKLRRRELEALQVLATEASLALSNALLVRERNQHRERLEAVTPLARIGNDAARVAHEIKNPLTTIRSTVQYLASGFETDSGRHELVQSLLGEVDRIQAALAHLLAPRSGQEAGEVDLLASFDHAVEAIRPWLDHQGISLALDLERGGYRVTGPPDEVHSVLFNVLLNAVHALPDGGAIRCSFQRLPATVGRAPRARIVIADSGQGIPAEAVAQVFLPRFTTRAGGSGLGLAICQEIVSRHRGRIELQSRVGLGTTVTIELPLLEEA